MLFIVLLNPSLDDTRLYLNCQYENVFTCKTIWEDPGGESCTDYLDNNYCTDKGREFNSFLKSMSERGGSDIVTSNDSEFELRHLQSILS